jgi:outer membrane receptor protein involved in Fe transport
LPFRGARLQSAFTVASAVTDVAETINGVDVPAGTRLPGSPKFQIANVAAYEVPIFGWSVGPTLTHSYIGESPDATPPTGTVGGFGTFDALLVIAKRDSRFQPELSFGVNNLTDKRGVATHQEVHNVVSGDPIEVFHYVMPRTLVGSVTVRFQ